MKRKVKSQMELGALECIWPRKIHGYKHPFQILSPKNVLSYRLKQLNSTSCLSMSNSQGKGDKHKGPTSAQ